MSGSRGSGRPCQTPAQVLNTVRRECCWYAQSREELGEPLDFLAQQVALIVNLTVQTPAPPVVLGKDVPRPQDEPAIISFGVGAEPLLRSCLETVLVHPSWQALLKDRDEKATVASLASVPLYLRAVQELGPLDLSLWDSGRCPWCGAKSAYARLSGQDPQRRILFCNRCWGEWDYPRIACVHCENRDPERLGYFYGEEDRPHRVYTCEGCMGYLKVTDERAAGRRVSPLVEDYVTGYLDEEARVRGYSQPF
ncbi:MAG: formate dehydrogenase accessory protein FdhE [Thermoleophilia bacterium]|nr:formate dehydrogenase accessory protein FdhE [Thermoleophilia bacterium]